MSQSQLISVPQHTRLGPFVTSFTLLCAVLLEQFNSVHTLDPIVELSEEDKGKRDGV